jgi:transcriptional regulator with XRE-family HTH domain
MRDWAIDYIVHVLEAKDWTMNRLSEEAGVAASTINRPLRDRNYPHSLSRATIRKIAAASGIDPAPYIPADQSEDRALFAGFAERARTYADRALEDLDKPPEAKGTPLAASPLNEIKIAVVGNLAQIVATIDREGLQRLRQKLDALEAMLDT